MDEHYYIFLNIPIFTPR